MSPSKAYLSYTLYIRPKLLYPLPCTSFTPAQCCTIQAPALAALLPKLKLNRHSPRAVLFSGPTYGGLSLPDLYDNQGFGQLSLFIRHLKLGDETGQLILSTLSHMQLSIGSSRPFLTTSFATYGKLIEPNWITSIWSYAKLTNTTIEVENQWLPTLAREGDATIIDAALTLNLTTSQIRQINACRIYLQVITISDISTVDGRYILPHILKGLRSKERISNLRWPTTYRLTHWAAWKLFLQYISSGTKLDRNLGIWLAEPHQQWKWFYNPTENAIYNHVNSTTWYKYTHLPPSRLTRHRRHHYVNPVPSSPPTNYCHPKTITKENDYIYSIPSQSGFPVEQSHSTPQLWDSSEIPAPFRNAPYLYQ
jgi:hypothetical protein